MRDKGYATIIRFDIGERIALELEDWVSYRIFLTGLYDGERGHTQFFRKTVREGMTVLDIGAHIGYYTLQAAVRVGSKGQVHAFEPVSETFTRLSHNIRLNGFQNVVANRCIVHDHSGDMRIVVADRHNLGSSSLLPFGENCRKKTETVGSITIDSYVAQKQLQQIHLAKIDVEGTELHVLKGMKKVLGQSQPQVLIEFDEELLRAHGSSSAEVSGFLKSFGYCPYRITRTGTIQKYLGDITRDNLLLFRKKRGMHQ